MSEIKKSYMKKAKAGRWPTPPPPAAQSHCPRSHARPAPQEHPDKGGDPEKFKAIARAYEILSDPEKREAYDQGGDEAVDGSGGGGGGGMQAEDVFSMFFGGGHPGMGRGGGRPQGPRKGEDAVHQHKVRVWRGRKGEDAVHAVCVCVCGGGGGGLQGVCS
jgi:DnaJ family protein A protein 2